MGLFEVFASNFSYIQSFTTYFNTTFYVCSLLQFLEKPIIINTNDESGLNQKISVKIQESVMIPCEILEESVGSDTKVIWSLNGLPINSNAQGYIVLVSF